VSSENFSRCLQKVKKYRYKSVIRACFKAPHFSFFVLFSGFPRLTKTKRHLSALYTGIEVIMRMKRD
jgi:hypothetical protein